jgi:hypothetical protein
MSEKRWRNYPSRKARDHRNHVKKEDENTSEKAVTNIRGIMLARVEKQAKKNDWLKESAVE